MSRSRHSHFYPSRLAAFRRVRERRARFRRLRLELLESRQLLAFTDINAGLPGVSQSSVAWADYDEDGDLDMLLTGLSGSSPISRVYRNTGGVFTDIGAGD